MTRQQELISAFTAAIQETGISELKKTTMFARSLKRYEEDQKLAKAA